MPYIASYTTISVQVVSLNTHVTNIHSRGILCRLSSSQQPVGGSVVAVAGDLDLTGLLKSEPAIKNIVDNLFALHVCK
ncbi:hypothetical protein TGPRC2_307450, partial [Toxoplasma gondii TgCatPRC2]